MNKEEILGKYIEYKKFYIDTLLIKGVKFNKVIASVIIEFDENFYSKSLNNKLYLFFIAEKKIEEYLDFIILESTATNIAEFQIELEEKFTDEPSQDKIQEMCDLLKSAKFFNRYNNFINKENLCVEDYNNFYKNIKYGIEKK